MPLILSLLLRVLLLAAGLAVAAGLLLAFVLLAALWAARALWARLAGRPTAPFAVRFGARAGFADMMRRTAPATRTPRADATGGARASLPDVSDVEPRELTRR